MANIKDVARRASVSVATVSRVLSKNYSVREETKLRVLQAVYELDYKLNRLASNLRKQETKTIIVLLPDISNPFFADIIRGIEDVAIKSNYYILIGTTENSEEREQNYIRLLGEHMADGVIFITARSNPNDYIELAKLSPLVLACEYLDETALPTVSIDNISSARKATQHLINLGHQRIGMVAGPLNVIVSRDRLKGYRQALHQNELKEETALIHEGDFKVEGGYYLTRRMLAYENRPTAIFASNDEMAVGAMKAATSLGLKVPEDLAVVGFDDIPLASLIEPQLTTIQQPRYKIGETAMRLILANIKNREAELGGVVLEDKLVIRKSCGAYLK